MKVLVLFALFGSTIFLNHHLWLYKKSFVYHNLHKQTPIYVMLPHKSVWYCGFASILADFHWLWLSIHAKELDPQNFYAYADYITSLDPHFNVVYRFAALYLMLQKQTDLSCRILYKSLSSSYSTDDWRIYVYIAYNNYFFNYDHCKTVQYLKIALEQPAHFNQLLKQDRCPPPHFLLSWYQKLTQQHAC